MKFFISITLIAVLSLWTDLLLGEETEGMALSYGIVFPDLNLATRENPSTLSIADKDRLSVLGALPITKPKDMPLEYDPKISDAPLWVSYGGNPKPFGIGLSVSTGKQPEIFASGACGTETIQVGYTYHGNPQTQTSTNTYAARFGEKNGTALSLIWGDERKVIGLGTIFFEWLVTEIDVASDLTLSTDPQPMGTIGIQTESFGLNYGYKAENFKNLKSNSENKFAGLYYKPGKHVVFDLYYQRFLSQFSASLGVIF